MDVALGSKELGSAKRAWWVADCQEVDGPLWASAVRSGPSWADGRVLPAGDAVTRAIGYVLSKADEHGGDGVHLLTFCATVDDLGHVAAYYSDEGMLLLGFDTAEEAETCLFEIRTVIAELTGATGKVVRMRGQKPGDA
jgi:hypothetical protein